MREQGFTEYEILETHNNIDIASTREIELQNQFGYVDKFCKIQYKTSVLNASKNNGGFKKGHIPWNFGKPASDESKKKMSKAQLGKTDSKETIEKRRNSMLKSHTTDEYRKAQSERFKLWWAERKKLKNKE